MVIVGSNNFWCLLRSVMYHLNRYFEHCLDIEIVDVLKVQGPAMFIVIYLITCYNVGCVCQGLIVEMI